MPASTPSVGRGAQYSGTPAGSPSDGPAARKKTSAGARLQPLSERRARDRAAAAAAAAAQQVRSSRNGSPAAARARPTATGAASTASPRRDSGSAPPGAHRGGTSPAQRKPSPGKVAGAAGRPASATTSPAGRQPPPSVPVPAPPSSFANSTGGVKKASRPPLVAAAALGGKQAPSRPGLRRGPGLTPPEPEPPAPPVVTARHPVSSAPTQRAVLPATAPAKPPPAMHYPPAALPDTARPPPPPPLQPVVPPSASPAAKASHRPPVALDQLDYTRYSDRRRWATLPAPVLRVMAGRGLEPPHATWLWAQGHRSPSDAVAAHERRVAEEERRGAAGDWRTFVGAGPADSAASAAADGDVDDDGVGSLADEQQARATEAMHGCETRRANGHYCCARCAAPVCAAEYQWCTPPPPPPPSLSSSSGPAASPCAAAAASALRSGYACFTHVSARALKVELVVSSSAGSGGGKGSSSIRDPFQRGAAYSDRGGSVGQCVDSILGRSGGGGGEELGGGDADSGPRSGKSTATATAAAAAPTAIAFCAACDGCLGAVALFIDPRTGRAEELFIANSICLVYTNDTCTGAVMAGHCLVPTADGAAVEHKQQRPRNGWMAGTPPSALSPGAKPATTRRVFIFQEGVPAADGGEGGVSGGGIDGKVIAKTVPADDDADGSSGGGSSGYDCGAAGMTPARWWGLPGNAHSSPASAGGATIEDLEDEDLMGDPTMFDDLDDEALYL